MKKKKYWQKVIGLIEENSRYHAAFELLKKMMRDQKKRSDRILLDGDELESVLNTAGLTFYEKEEETDDTIQ